MKPTAVAKSADELYPIKVEYNFMREELVVCTSKDIRFINMKVGRIDRYLTGLLKNEDDEISTFCTINQFRKFIIGD